MTRSTPKNRKLRVEDLHIVMMAGQEERRQKIENHDRQVRELGHDLDKLLVSSITDRIAEWRKIRQITSDKIDEESTLMDDLLYEDLMGVIKTNSRAGLKEIQKLVKLQPTDMINVSMIFDTGLKMAITSNILEGRRRRRQLNEKHAEMVNNLNDTFEYKLVGGFISHVKEQQEKKQEASEFFAKELRELNNQLDENFMEAITPHVAALQNENKQLRSMLEELLEEKKEVISLKKEFEKEKNLRQNDLKKIEKLTKRLKREEDKILDMECNLREAKQLGKEQLTLQEKEYETKFALEMHEQSKKQSCLESEISLLTAELDEERKSHKKALAKIDTITSYLKLSQNKNSKLKMKLATKKEHHLQEKEDWSTLKNKFESEIQSLRSKIEKHDVALTNTVDNDKQCYSNSGVIEDSRPTSETRSRDDDANDSHEGSLLIAPPSTDAVPRCGHPSANKTNCQVPVSVKLDCGHVKQTTCYNSTNEYDQLFCNEECEKIYSCEMEHKCEAVCGREHSHSADSCPVQVEYVIPKCGHTHLFKKVCGSPLPENIICREKIQYTCPNCGHDQYRECHAKGEACKSQVEFLIPGCGHRASYKKNCGDPLPENVWCRHQIKYTSEVCGHEQYRACSEKEVCKHPCSKNRPDCGHPCKNLCHESCASGTCKVCEIEYKNILQKAREDAQYKIESCKQKARKSDSMSLATLHSSDHLEFSNVTEICQTFFQAYTQYEISIKTIKKCPSPSVEYFEYVTKANGVLQMELCKIISAEEDFTSLKTLTNHMKQFTAKNQAPLYGLCKYAPPGDYSDCDLDNMTMIVSDVLIGETIDRSKITINPTSLKEMKEYLRTEKKDSVLITENGTPARYRVFNKNQIHVKYVVRFSLKKRALTEVDFLKGLADGEQAVDLDTFDLRDVSNPLCNLVQRAVSLYKGDCCKRDAYTQSVYPLKNIKRVGIAVNQRLEREYEEVKKKYGNEGEEVVEVYAYHATHMKNVQSIIETNLDPNRTPIHGRAYGFGCYFSEHPTFSMKYGQDCMFVFKVLLVKGKYKKVQPDKAGFCQQLVLRDASLFKPVFVLYF